MRELGDDAPLSWFRVGCPPRTRNKFLEVKEDILELMELR